MTTILQNAVFSKRVTAQASDDNYNYHVDYEVADSGKALVTVTINASDKSGKYVGSMTYNINNNSNNVSCPCTMEIAALLPMFDSILAEIKATLIE